MWCIISVNKYVTFCFLIQISGGEFGVDQETNVIKLLEKQYQERLEEEIAKVSLQFVQKIIVVYTPFEPSKTQILLMAMHFFFCYTLHAQLVFKFLTGINHSCL